MECFSYSPRDRRSSCHVNGLKQLLAGACISLVREDVCCNIRTGAICFYSFPSPL